MATPAHRVLGLILLACVLAALPATAGLAGKLAGRTADATDGTPLGGVTVIVRSQSLIGGPRSTQTDADGTFAFAELPPGSYEVEFRLDGYTPLIERGVAVHLDRTTALEAALATGAVAERITVRDEAAPLVDPERAAEGQVFAEEYLRNAAIGTAGRSYHAVIAQTAGVVGVGNPSVFGSTGGENVYLIDGGDTTDPVTATFGTNFNFDAIQEISFQTAGFEAEYGRATGGVVNLVTKSGGNRFAGTFDVRYRTHDFAEAGEHFDPDVNRAKFVNPAATLGGPIRTDRAWFFASYEDIDSERTPFESVLTRDFEGRNYIGKVTWQVQPSWRAVLKGSSDPATITHINAGRTTLPEASATQKQGGDIYQAELSGVLLRDLLWDLRGDVNHQQLDTFPTSGDLNTSAIIDETSGIHSNNHDNAQFSDRDRDAVATSLTWFAGGLWGDHEIKTGLGRDDLFFRTSNFTTGGAFYQHRNGRPRLLFVSPIQPPFEFDGIVENAYLQDAWHPLANLTLKLGARWDRAAFENDRGVEVADMEEVQPRLGFAWDLGADARTVVRGSWGRFMHPNALTMPSFARSEQSPQDVYFACARAFPSRAACEEFFGTDVVISDPLGLDPIGFILIQRFASQPNQVARGLEATMAESWTIGVERQVGRSSAVEVSYVDKETTGIFEDTCDGNVPTPSADASCDFYVIANLPGLRRSYQGVLLRAESRAFERLHLVGSYAYSRSRGHIEYTQNAGSDFDLFPAHFENRFGYLGDDRRHRVKLNGFVELPWDLLLGVDASWSSAFAYTPNEPADPYGTRFLEPRGSRRANDNYQLDLELRKGFAMKQVRLDLIGTVFNVLDDEQTTGVCDRPGGCGSDTAGRPIQLGDPTDFQQPRRYEVGLRLEF